MNNISKYNDIALLKREYSGITGICTVDTDIKHDWFDCYVSKEKDVDIYAIEKQSLTVGCATLYDYNEANGNISIYGRISEKQYFGELLKVLLSLVDYAFTSHEVNKVDFVYREDNYFFDDVYRFLHFIKEDVLRAHLSEDGGNRNLNVYGLLSSESRRYKSGRIQAEFTWDDDYSQQTICASKLKASIPAAHSQTLLATPITL